MSGSSTANQPGVYGTLGIPAPANVPGNRSGASSWTDASGNLWFFGGGIYDPNANTDSCGNGSQLNDLWEFNPSTNEWAWMGGSNTVGSYSQADRVAGPEFMAHWDRLPPETFPEADTAARAGPTAAAISGSSGARALMSTATMASSTIFGSSIPSTNEWAWMGGSNAMGPCNE